jgi:catechol-2,3-dioxygenase
MGKVTAIGGVFIKVKDIKMMTAWYQKNLGIEFGNNSYVDLKCSDKKGDSHTVFSMFQNTEYYKPSTKDCMINFMVNDLDAL